MTLATVNKTTKPNGPLPRQFPTKRTSPSQVRPTKKSPQQAVAQPVPYRGASVFEANPNPTTQSPHTTLTRNNLVSSGMLSKPYDPISPEIDKDRLNQQTEDFLRSAGSPLLSFTSPSVRPASTIYTPPSSANSRCSSGASRSSTLVELATTPVFDENDTKSEVLEQELNDTFRERLQFIMHLKESLASLLSEEEESLVKSMKNLLCKSTRERDKMKEREYGLQNKIEEFEKQLTKEYQEKSKAMEKIAQFKQQSGQITQKLRESLREMTVRYKREAEGTKLLTEQIQSLQSILEQEVRKREKSEKHCQELVRLHNNPKDPEGELCRIQCEKHQLTLHYEEQLQKAKDLIRAQQKKLNSYDFDPSSKALQSEIEDLRSENTKIRALLKMQGDISPPLPNGSNESSSVIKELEFKYVEEKNKRALLQQFVEEKFTEYNNLLQQEQRVMEYQRQRIEQLERENKSLQEHMASYQSEDFHTEYMELFNELKSMVDPEGDLTQGISSSAESKMQLQHRLIQILLKKLKSEEQMRLKTEEQAAKVVTNEEKTITVLETRIRELQSSLSDKEAQDSMNASERSLRRESSPPTSRTPPSRRLSHHLHQYDPQCYQQFDEIKPLSDSFKGSVRKEDKLLKSRPSPSASDTSMSALQQQLDEVARDMGTSLYMWNKTVDQAEHTLKDLNTTLSEVITPINSNVTTPHTLASSLPSTPHSLSPSSISHLPHTNKQRTRINSTSPTNTDRREFAHDIQTPASLIATSSVDLGDEDFLPDEEEKMKFERMASTRR